MLLTHIIEVTLNSGVRKNSLWPNLISTGCACIVGRHCKKIQSRNETSGILPTDLSYIGLSSFIHSLLGHL